MSMTKFAYIFILFIFTQTSFAQKKDSSELKDPIYEKPFIVKIGTLQLGGYADFSYEFEEEDGITEESSFKANRFNLFAYTKLYDRATVFGEIEFEEGGEEISLEIAQLDFKIIDEINLRGGIILPPLGRFNVNHDSPKNNFTRRPLVSTEIIPSTLSELGGGFFGNIFFNNDVRLNYNLYLTNGFNDGIILNSSGATRFKGGEPSLGEDNNSVPSYTGRIGLIPVRNTEVGFSFHHGVYNIFKIEGETIDEKRNETLIVFDWDVSRQFTFGTFNLSGELAYAKVDVPRSLIGLYAQRQQGMYSDFSYDFLKGFVKALPRSYFTFVMRYDYVNFDRDIAGDFMRQISAGLNFRPFEDTVLKLNYSRGWSYDRLNNETNLVFISGSIATYF